MAVLWNGSFVANHVTVMYYARICGRVVRYGVGVGSSNSVEPINTVFSVWKWAIYNHADLGFLHIPSDKSLKS